MHRPGDRLAVVDMGTNVFGLVVGTVHQDGRFQWDHRSETEVGLASHGFGTLNETIQRRAETALHRHLQTAIQHQAVAFYGFGTAALRQWDGSTDWLQGVGQRLEQSMDAGQRIPCRLQVVSGEQEAEWIRYGLLQSGLLEDGPVLINDIGGGSVEIVLCHGQQTYFACSLPLGMRKLVQQFPILHPDEYPQSVAPVPHFRATYDQCYQYLSNEFRMHLGEVLGRIQPLRILGTAGPYRTLDQWARACTQTQNDADFLIPRSLCASFGEAATLTLQGPCPPLHPLATDAVVHAAALMLALSDVTGGLPVQCTDLSMREGALMALFEGH